MRLGSRGVPGLARAGRCLVVWVTGTIGLALAAGPARRAAAEVLTGSWMRLPLDQALVDVAAVSLLAALAWGWLGLSVTVVEALRAQARARLAGDEPVALRRGQLGPAYLPGPLHRLVLAACGVALTSGIAAPALASGGVGDTHHERGLTTLIGLPLPERAVAPAATGRRAREPATRRTVVVRPGDCLWTIATRNLPAAATTADIAARWREIYAANRAVIGADPDLLEPGLRLILPREDPS